MPRLNIITHLTPPLATSGLSLLDVQPNGHQLEMGNQKAVFFNPSSESSLGMLKGVCAERALHR